LLKPISQELAEKMHQNFSYILNSNDPNFETLYLEAAYLNPRNASSNLLTDQQKTLAELLFVDMVVLEDGLCKLAPFQNKLGERADRMAALINNYKSVVSDTVRFLGSMLSNLSILAAIHGCQSV
jgi:hypothetical protein